MSVNAQENHESLKLIEVNKIWDNKFKNICNET
jgi:hypothetical protein